MAIRIPEPTPTAEGPAYEGRLLDRPDEEVVDQGAGFDIRILMNRRTLLGAGLAGIGSVALAACAGGTTSSSTASSDTVSGAEIPDETAGPYPADGSNGPDVLTRSGIVRSDIRSSIGTDEPIDGVGLTFTFTVTDMAGGDVPFAGAAVYAWHCDAQGRYSMYSEGVEEETWLRGVQVADADGTVTFTSIMPGCYTGRWTHIHFEVYPDADSITDSTKAIATSQMALPENVLTEVYRLPAYDGSVRNLSRVTLESDNVFGEDGGELQMATVTGDTDAGYSASLDVRVDTTTAPTGGAAPGGGAPEGTGPGGRPPAGEPPAPASS
jgi:protocatechuate 3,4-dioxygenase beta subunit